MFVCAGQTWELLVSRLSDLPSLSVIVLVLDPKPRDGLPIVNCLVLFSQLEDCKIGDVDVFSIVWFESETSSLLSETR